MLITQGRYRSKQAATEADPFAAVYAAQVPFKQPGDYSILAVTKDGDEDGRRARPGQGRQHAQDDRIPEVGEMAPKVETDTKASARGDIASIDTRTPPSDMHEKSFADVRRQEAGRAAVRDPAAVPVARLRAGGRRRACS